MTGLSRFFCKDISDMSDRELLNLMYEKTAEYDITLEDIMELRKNNPGNPLYTELDSPQEFMIRYNALRALLNQDFNDVLEYVQKGLKVRDDSPYLYYIRGQAYTHLLRYDDAERDLKTATTLKDDYFRAHYELGVLYFNKAVYELHKKKESPDPKVLLEKCLDNKDIRKSIKSLEKAKKIEDKKPQTYDLLGRIYYFSNNMFLAKKNLKKAVEYGTKCSDTKDFITQIKSTNA